MITEHSQYQALRAARCNSSRQYSGAQRSAPAEVNKKNLKIDLIRATHGRRIVSVLPRMEKRRFISTSFRYE
jgi:hypothetical protein